MTVVKRTERGWAGHFCSACDCGFRRNTLLEKGDVRVVVSTVGRMKKDGKIVKIAPFRFYETMAFFALKGNKYADANVHAHVHFLGKWMIGTPVADLDADEMHERAVREIVRRIKRGQINSDGQWCPDCMGVRGNEDCGVCYGKGWLYQHRRRKS